MPSLAETDTTERRVRAALCWFWEGREGNWPSSSTARRYKDDRREEGGLCRE